MRASPAARQVLSARGMGPQGDTELAERVRKALEWDKSVPHERIRTTVTNGVVILEGTVESWNQSVDAVRAVCNLPGVQAVKNALVIVLHHLTPAVVRAALESALEREAALAASEHVEIAVTDGRVVIRGVIPAWAAVEPLLAAVWAIPGVVEVEHHLAKQL